MPQTQTMTLDEKLAISNKALDLGKQEIQKDMTVL